MSAGVYLPVGSTKPDRSKGRDLTKSSSLSILMDDSSSWCIQQYTVVMGLRTPWLPKELNGLAQQLSSGENCEQSIEVAIIDMYKLPKDLK
jgi:hypothetical protein